MPTYEYACTSCHEHLEVVQSFKDAPLTECPSCGGSLRKVFAPIGVVFKGSGFYKTDSRPGSKAPSKSESSGNDSSASPGTSSPDTKAPAKEAKDGGAKPAEKSSGSTATKTA